MNTPLLNVNQFPDYTGKPDNYDRDQEVIMQESTDNNNIKVQNGFTKETLSAGGKVWMGYAL